MQVTNIHKLVYHPYLLEIAFQVVESEGHVLNLPTTVGNLDALDSSTVTVNLMLRNHKLYRQLSYSCVV